nr:outer membrane protein assembly factor BamB [Zoogloeaceae bacterium]
MKLVRASLWAVAALSVFSAGCSSLNPFASSGPKPAELVEFRETASLSRLWEARIGSAGPHEFTPAIVDDNIYAAAHNGEVVRLDAGRRVWTANAGKRLSAGVGSDGRLVVVVATDGEVIAFDAQNGGERWRAPAGTEVIAQPTVTGLVVVLRGSDSRLVGLNASDGSKRWTYQRTAPALALRNTAGMIVAQDAVVVGYPGGKVVGVSLDNGGPLWEITISTARGVTELERITDVAGTVVLGRRELCAVTYQGRASCFDTGNGSALWSREFSSAVGMDRDSRFVVITDDADAVHGLDAFSGANIWKQAALARRGVSRPLIVGDFVAVADRQGYVHLLGREDGVFVARARADSSAVLVPPQRLGLASFVVQTSDGGIFALEAR